MGIHPSKASLKSLRGPTALLSPPTLASDRATGNTYGSCTLNERKQNGERTYVESSKLEQTNRNSPGFKQNNDTGYWIRLNLTPRR